MNKIRNIHELREEIRRLKTLSDFQLKEMKYDLRDIREDFRISNLVQKIISFVKRGAKQ